jgi:ubiquinol-cytochrome c reductase cytochrome c1 subunit
MRKLLFALAGIVVLFVAYTLVVFGLGEKHRAPAPGGVAEAAEPRLPKQQWSFSGGLRGTFFGTYDRAAAQRGLQVYNDVCSRCHALNQLHYGDLGPAGPGGGLGYSEDEVKAIAAQKQVTDGPNDQGEMFQRPGRPSDRFVAPFPNEQAARAALNGALPPDLSLIVNAREGGPNYVYGILTGYTDPPEGFKLQEGMNYNKYFPGHQIAMPKPLSEGQIAYADGTANTLEQEAHDVVTFLTWAANPEMVQRKQIGVRAVLFLLLMTGLTYAVKRKVWADAH